MNKHKLAIITTHPVQYYAPLFALLAKQNSLEIKVFYTWQQGSARYDRDFGKDVQWDIPLLEGYDYCFVSNKNKTGRGFWDVKNPDLVKLIETWQASAVLVIGWNYLSHLKAMLHFKKRISVLFRGDSTLLDETAGLKQLLRRVFLHWVYRHIDYALYVGAANKAYLLKHGLQEKQLLFTPHAVDNKRFATINAMHESFIRNTRDTFGITDDDIAIVFCGKLLPKKNPLLLAEAVQEMNNDHLHVIFVGDGVLETKLKEAIAGNCTMHLLPFQNQSMMPAVYRLGNIFCLPSAGPGETWGLAVNEAMACGRAVLVSDKAGCAADLVKDDENGYVFRSNDKEDFKKQLSKLLNNKTRLASMGKASEAIIQQWNFEAIAKAVTNLFNNP